ncbi:alpha/beta hydrolase [Oceanihabitans sp. IOP_32]|uniref:alpha/beta hydrolase n=1 Tax=Oceanihabitans sp. IOP_32 TaxID=2529032 RepID=UPI001293FBDB|nr:alpha/beta hydrolase [Oceanihabitans sp. IOP_32]QFZ53764.1 alpha/beta hydrolase [Oceanihabitans sp. IOP_32]
MHQEIIHVYFMPGMAASPKIFEYIKLPENKFKMHTLEWINPLENESLSSYASRISKHIYHDNVVLVGISFGGVLVQEISTQIRVRKLIIISSIKSAHEMPKRMRIVKSTKLYKLIPTHFVGGLEGLVKYVSGSDITKRLEFYKKYLAVNDSQYLSWAIKNMLCWKPVKHHPEIIHIHGDKDSVFPIKNISNCITVKGGSHVMIITKYKWFNANLPELILKN